MSRRPGLLQLPSLTARSSRSFARHERLRDGHFRWKVRAGRPCPQIAVRSRAGVDPEGFLGCLGFVCGASEHFRPCLGPLYVWAATHSLRSAHPLPEFVRLAFHFLLGRFLEGQSTIGPAAPRRDQRELFRADAKASEDMVAVGGWERSEGKSPGQSRWSAVELNDRNAPWIFHRGEREMSHSGHPGSRCCGQQGEYVPAEEEEEEEHHNIFLECVPHEDRGPGRAARPGSKAPLGATRTNHRD